MKFLKLGFNVLFALSFSVLVINSIVLNFVDDDIILLSPYVGENLKILDRDRPTKVFIQKLNAKGEPMSDKLILTDHPSEIQTLITDLKWTWVTSLKELPSNEWQYSLSFENENFGLIYPFYYYPDSDVIQFLGNRNPLSINSSDTLKELINSY